MDDFELARALFGRKDGQPRDAVTKTTALALSDSADGKVVVDLGGMSVTQDGTQGVEIDTVPSVLAGQEVSVEIVGGKATATGVIGWGDGLASGIQDAIDMAEAAILSVDVEYAESQSQTVPPAGGWATVAPAWQEGWYIWQRTKTVASTGESYSDPVCISGRDGQDGAQGPQGADAITMAISSSEGYSYGNAFGGTVLSAHVYRAGTELTAHEIALIATVRWYRDGAAVGTGPELAIAASQVTDRATYAARLEG